VEYISHMAKVALNALPRQSENDVLGRVSGKVRQQNGFSVST